MPILSSASQIGAALRLAARGLMARNEPEPPLEAPRRKPAVERTGVFADAASVERYLRATEGADIAALQGEGAPLPPLFPTTWETERCLELFAGLDRPLPVGGVVHLESEILCLRPIRRDDTVRCRVELERAERVSRGLRLTVTARNWTATGQLCSQSTAVFLARTRAPQEPRTDDPTRRDPAAEGPQTWEPLASWVLGGGAGRRFARASGDYNPIHLWGWTARPFGFKRPILHGFCTAAMAAHALVEGPLGGDPTALRRMRIAFRAPLPLPAHARLWVGDADGQRWFRVTDDPGDTLFAQGTWAGTVRADPT
ncbi:MAG TPA: MaoC/PaaZ C-terminal domain-containing protein [Longimicrobium sp.]|jgi:acyl dehydratase